jgi:hypothetical protein
MRKGPQGKLGPSKDPEVKKLRKKQFDTYMAEKGAQFDKAERLQKTYEGASPKIKAELEEKFKGVFNPEEMVASSRRDAAKTFKTGGRVNLRGGGCAKRGVKKNAYGKNS